jgi:hypothetical protein
LRSRGRHCKLAQNQDADGTEQAGLNRFYSGESA